MKRKSSVTLETDEKNSITITGGTSRFTIMGQSGDDFPALPDVAQEEAYTLGQNELRNLIRQTIFSISQESTKQILTGELFEMKENALQVVSAKALWNMTLQKRALWFPAKL